MIWTIRGLPGPLWAPIATYGYYCDHGWSCEAVEAATTAGTAKATGKATAPAMAMTKTMTVIITMFGDIPQIFTLIPSIHYDHMPLPEDLLKSRINIMTRTDI